MLRRMSRVSSRMCSITTRRNARAGDDRRAPGVPIRAVAARDRCDSSVGTGRCPTKSFSWRIAAAHHASSSSALSCASSASNARAPASSGPNTSDRRLMKQQVAMVIEIVADQPFAHQSQACGWLDAASSNVGDCRLSSASFVSSIADRLFPGCRLAARLGLATLCRLVSSAISSARTTGFSPPRNWRSGAPDEKFKIAEQPLERIHHVGFKLALFHKLADGVSIVATFASIGWLKSCDFSYATASC